MALADSFSLFLYAFKSQKNYFDLPDSIWKRSQLEPENNFYFSHVQDFFIKNNSVTTTVIDESCCLRYELARDKATENQKEKLLLVNHLFTRTSQTIEAEAPAIKFKVFTDNSILGPAILYNPLTGIGILSFGFSLSKESGTLQNLIDLNYRSRIFGRADSSAFSITRNDHPGATDQEHKISLALGQFNPEIKRPKGNQDHLWNIQTLVRILLQDVPANGATILSPNRLQVFTYLQTEAKLNEQELYTTLFRLRRVYNSNYAPGPDFLRPSPETEQTFEQIHFGASIEGCVVIVNDDQDKLPHFLKSYGVVIKNRYLWSYLLAYYQRLAIIEMNIELSLLYDNGLPKLQTLSQVSSNLIKIELRTLFSQVSYFSQHNDFYEFCKRNLKLADMYGAIKEKLADMSLKAVSGEIIIDDLLRKMMVIIVQNSGAERVVLVLNENGRSMVRAVHNAGDKEVEIVNDPLNDSPDLPVAVIQYSLSTLEKLVMNGPDKDARFAPDKYLVSKHPLSIVSFPIISKGSILGCVYLENNLPAGAFSTDRLTILELLSGQITVSLENAMLYENLEQKVAERTRELTQEKKKSDDLLLNILPVEIADELKQKGNSPARRYNDVSVLFTDFVNFTGISDRLAPEELVAEIDYCFKAFDEITTNQNLEKIKTIGDAYLAVCGLPVVNKNHALNTVNAALAISEFIIQYRKERQAQGKPSFDIRIGINSGPVIAGIVGNKKFAYDIWGDTVNIAARMEQNSESGKINVSHATHELIKEDFACTYRGEIEAKNKGKMRMYFVSGTL
jgi:class 3 adenylate cyclase